MSFLVRGDRGPTNIPEGGVPIDREITNFSPRMFQSIARAGLEAAGEGSFERTRRRRGSKNRMAGQADSLSRSIERGLQSGGGEEFLTEPQATTTMPRRGKKKFELPPGSEALIDRFPTQDNEGKPSRLAETLGGKTRRGSKTRDEMRDPNARPTVYNRRRRRSRDEMRDPNAKPTVRSGNYEKFKDEQIRKYSSPPPRKATAAEMEERRRNPLGIGQVAEI